jgi:hypothetical protein
MKFDRAGVMFGAALAVAGFSAAYWLWPDGIMGRPISSLTIMEFFKICGSLALGLVGVGGVAGAIKDANEPFG